MAGLKGQGKHQNSPTGDSKEMKGLIVRDLHPCILHFEPNTIHGEIYS